MKWKLFKNDLITVFFFNFFWFHNRKIGIFFFLGGGRRFGSLIFIFKWFIVHRIRRPLNFSNALKQFKTSWLTWVLFLVLETDSKATPNIGTRCCCRLGNSSNGSSERTRSWRVLGPSAEIWLRYTSSKMIIGHSEGSWKRNAPLSKAICSAEDNT